MSDSIPLRYFQEIGFQRNVVILTQPRNYVKQPTSFMPLMRLALRKYPHMLSALMHRHVMYNAQLRYLEEQEKLGQTLVIAPERKLKINHTSHDPAIMQEVYDMGKQQGLAELNRIKAFLLA